MARVNLSRMPARHKTFLYDFSTLRGGLNLRDAETALRPDETPECVNVWWEDGALRSRPGQEWASAPPGSPASNSTASEPAPLASGTCGEETAESAVTWAVSTGGTLRVQGTGRMRDYATGSGAAPWSAWAEQITRAEIGEGVTYLGAWALRTLEAVEIVTLPASLTVIGTGNFRFLPESAYVYYAGTDAQWDTVALYSANEMIDERQGGYRPECDSAGPEEPDPSGGTDPPEESEEQTSSYRGYALAPEPFHEYAVFHAGDTLFCVRPQEPDADGLPVPVPLRDGVPACAGEFFRFDEYLFYKTRGGFYGIAYESASGTLSAFDVTERAFVPTILINTDPDTGGGSLYQPENRLSPRKRVVYNANAGAAAVVRRGNGVRRAFLLSTAGAAMDAEDADAGDGSGAEGDGEGGTGSGTPVEIDERTAGLSREDLTRLARVESVYVDGAFVEPALYYFDQTEGVLIFHAPPRAGASITITVRLANAVYHLPVRNVDAVTEILVDGVALKAGEYTADLAAGTVTFHEPPAVTDPPTNNTVEIVYQKTNARAYRDILDCRFAAVYGTGTQMCVVLGGNTDQPNAVFWSGHAVPWRAEEGTAVLPVLNYAYFPMEHYNLAGDTADAVTGFGRQYDQLLVFKERSVGKLTYSVETVDGRDTISLAYQRVNDHMGAACPGSVRTIENNLVFADRTAGVCMVASTSPAFENNIRSLSEKINGSAERPGLLLDLRAASAGPMSAHDDGARYYLAVNGHVWVWDYAASTPSDPSWFFFTDMNPVGWMQFSGSTYHLNENGRLTKLGTTLDDYGQGIRKVYQFPVRHFGNYDRLKDVLTVLFSVRADTPGDTAVIYETDYENRADIVNLVTEGYDRVSERDLTVRDLSVPRYAAVFRRRPMCRHVRHFALRLESAEAGRDLSLYGVQIQIRFLGRDR